MKKYVWIAVLCLCCALIFAGCGGCKHEWAAATCTDPKTCTLCGITEGEAKGHIWEDATCLLPKKCATCHLTEGVALSHNWEEATTEAPKTCTNCQATEGEKLKADPRFTTESTKHLYGRWAAEVEFTGEMLDMPGYFESLPATMYFEFGKTGDLIVTLELHDNFAYLEEMKRFTADVMYALMEEQGIGKDLADAAMKEVYGMTMTEYVDAAVEKIDKDKIFGAFTQDMVYYVGQNGIYNAYSWYDEEFDCSTYTLEDDVLIIEEVTLEEDGEPLKWTRVTE